MKLLDYVYFRTARHYEREHSATDPERFGFGWAWGLSGLGLGEIVAVCLLLIGPEYIRYLKPFAIGETIILFPYCFLRYFNKKRYREVCAIWGNEDGATSKRRGFLLKISAFIILSFPFVGGAIRWWLRTQ